MGLFEVHYFPYFYIVILVTFYYKYELFLKSRAIFSYEIKLHI